MRPYKELVTLLLLLTFLCFFWHSVAHIAHLRHFCILCTRPKSCFGGLNEQSGYLVLYWTSLTLSVKSDHESILWYCETSYWQLLFSGMIFFFGFFSTMLSMKQGRQVGWIPTSTSIFILVSMKRRRQVGCRSGNIPISISILYW